MLRETQTIVDNLRVLLEARLGAPVRIVETDDVYAKFDADTIGVLTTSFGDPYSGGQYSSTVSFKAGGLAIQFNIAEHDLSGQCDSWTLDVKGAAAADRAVFTELFHPRQRRGHFGNHARIELTFDGEKSEFGS